MRRAWARGSAIGGALALSLAIGGPAWGAGPAADADAEPDPEMEIEIEPEPEPRTHPPAPPAVPNHALWEGLVGYELVLNLEGRSVLRGQLVGQYRDGLVVARDRDGEVVAVPRAQVARAQVDLRSKYGVRVSSRIDSGRGLIGWGGTFIGLGAPVLITGIVFTFVTPGDLWLSLPMLLTGGPFVVGGATMVAVGVERRNYWREMTDRSDQLGFGREIQPMLERTVVAF